MQAANGEMNIKLEGVLTSSRICRFCLSPAGVMSSIFEDGDLNSLPLSSKIMAFISIQMYVNDGLPSLICHRCLYQVEKSYDFKTQCEASDAVLRKYLANSQPPVPPKTIVKIENTDGFMPSFDLFNITKLHQSLIYNSTFCDSPFKRKRGRPRKEENMMFYNPPIESQINCSKGLSDYADDEIKILDGIESVVTIVDPRSEMLSNSDDESKVENKSENDVQNNGTEKDDVGNNDIFMDTLALAKAKGKMYMGVMIGIGENGVKTRRHLCKGCGKTFGHCSDLRKHVLVHTGERPFHCRICSKTFSRSTNLNKHMKVHSGQKPYFCTDCPKSFTTKGDLQRHLIIHSGIKQFACSICNQCFSRKDKLTRHSKLHRNNGFSKMSFKCHLCSLVFHSKLDLKGHINLSHSEKKKNENEEEDSEINSIDYSEFKKEESTNGDIVIKQEKELRVQNDSSPEVESMVINLDPFQMDSDLNDVMSTWEGNKDQRINTEEISTTEDNKTLHYIVENGEINKPIFRCNICCKKFSEITYLRSHMITHSTIKPHKCNVCEKSFTRRRELLRHENVHTGFKPFKCNTCGKAFSRKDKLVRHEKIHNSVRNLSFFKMEDLIPHHRSLQSDNELPSPASLNLQSNNEFQCPTCFVSCGNLEIYVDHLKTHADKNEARQKSNLINYENDDDYSEEENATNYSLEQLNANPAITVTSVSKSSKS